MWCIYCGAEQDVPVDVSITRCHNCSQTITVARLPAVAARPANPLSRSVTRSREALAELIRSGPSTETSAMIGELQVFEKRLDWFGVFVPFVGPWLIQRREDLTVRERSKLTALSLGSTVVAVLAIVALCAAMVGKSPSLDERIRSEIDGLGAIAQNFRVQNGAYPDAEVWARTAHEPDPRFFDPWGRAYLYFPTARAVTIATLGRDGVEGGSGKDADVSRTFTATDDAAS